MAKKNLLPEVAECYQLKGIDVGNYEINGFGTVDFEKITLAEADAYYALNMPFLVKKNKKTAAAEQA
jgi:hypothetical protein